jgi:thioredoxin-dependent peroxiredoxin
MGIHPGMLVGDQEHRVQGSMLMVGVPAPDFVLVANDLSERTLANYVDKIKVLSMIPSIDTSVCAAQTRYRDMQFADAYGVYDTDWRTCQRALFVLDRDNTIQYAEYVPVIGNEVNFEAALAKVRELG